MSASLPFIRSVGQVVLVPTMPAFSGTSGNFVFYFLSKAAGLAFLLPVVVGVWRFRILEPTMKMFTMWSFLGAIEVCTEYLLGTRGINNMFLVNAYLVVEVPLLLAVYRRSVTQQNVKRLLTALSIFFIAAWVIDKIYWEMPGQLNEEMHMLSRVVTIVSSVVVLNSAMKNVSCALTGQPIFWVAAGSILYSAGSLLVLGLGNEFMKMSLSYFMYAWTINWTLSIVSCVMYTKGLLCRNNV